MSTKTVNRQAQRISALTAAVLLVWTCANAVAQAEQEVLVQGSPRHAMTPDERATVACLNAFVAKILPTDRYQVRVTEGKGGSSVFEGKTHYSRANMQITATAGSEKEIASGSCTVASDAHVERLSVTVRDAARLASLHASELKLVASAR